jgi:hypothetical protein
MPIELSSERGAHFQEHWTLKSELVGSAPIMDDKQLDFHDFRQASINRWMAHRSQSAQSISI